MKTSRKQSQQTDGAGRGATASRRRRSARAPRRGWLVGGGLVAIIAIVATVVWFSPWLVVKNIDVEGVVHGDKDAIVEASGISEIKSSFAWTRMPQRAPWRGSRGSIA